MKRLYRYIAAYNFNDLMEDDNLKILIKSGGGAIHTTIRYPVGPNHQRILPKDLTYPSLTKGQPYTPITWELEKEIQKFTKTCRENSVIPILYICIHTIPTGLLQQYPKCIDWLVKDENGNPLPQTMYHLNNHFRHTRRQGCINNPGWINHLKEELKYVLNLGFEGIFYDNPVWIRCYCKYCQEKFRKYIKGKIGKEYPVPQKSNWKSEIWHWYTFFLCDSLQKAIKKLSCHAKSINPRVFITMNTSPPTVHPPSTRILPSYYVNDSVDWIFYEGLPLSRKEKGKIIWNIEDYSYAQAEAGKKIVTSVNYGRRGDYQEHFNLLKLGMAEAISYRISFINPGSCKIEKFREIKEIKNYFNFIKKYENYYYNSVPYADIGIFFSYETLFWRLAPSQVKESVDFSVSRGRDNGYPAYKNICNFLTHSHFPYITLINLDKANIHTLILPDVTNLTENEIKRIKELVKEGMGLVASRETSLYNKNLRRKTYALSEIFGIEYPKDEVVKNNYGKGRVILIPQNLEEWLKPDNNHKQMFSSLKWVNQSTFLIKKVEAPKSLLITLLKYKEKILLNMVNYNVTEDGKVEPCRDVEILLNKKMDKINLLTPDQVDKKIEIERGAKEVKINIPLTYIYNLLVLE